MTLYLKITYTAFLNKRGGSNQPKYFKNKSKIIEKIIVDIDWDRNYGASSVQVPGCIATHSTIEGVKEGFESALEFHLDGMREDGDEIPEELQGDYELYFKMSVSALLHHYDGILTRAALSRITGIHRAQLGHYMTGHRKPRKKQRQRIVEGIRKIGRELEMVE